MSMWFRRIRKSKWYKNSEVPWLGVNDLQGDALTDLTTSNNTLSMWVVEDNLSNLSRIISAIASTNQNLSIIDYALIDFAIVEDLGVKVGIVPGDTPDKHANELWHRDFQELTAGQILGLADAIRMKGKLERFQSRTVLDLIKTAVKSGHIEKLSLSESIQKKIEV